MVRRGRRDARAILASVKKRGRVGAANAPTAKYQSIVIR
jgi:hypothetical protein